MSTGTRAPAARRLLRPLGLWGAGLLLSSCQLLNSLPIPGGLQNLAPPSVNNFVQSARTGNVGGMVGAALPTVGALVPAALSGDVNAILRASGPLGGLAVVTITRAVEQHQAERRLEQARYEEDRRLQVAAAQLFYAGQCSRPGLTGGVAPGASTGREARSAAVNDDPRALDAQAEALFGRGDYAGATPLLQRALALREGKLGPTDPEVTRAQNRLAVALLAQNEFVAAAAYGVKALTQREAAYKASLGARGGRQDPAALAAALDLAESQSTLGAVYRATGAYQEALPQYQRALELRQRSLQTDHLCIAQSQSGLGELQQSLGAYGAALPLYQSSLATRRRRLPAEHRDIAHALSDLASLYRAMGVYPRAEELYRQALAIRLKLGGGHPDVAESLHDLGSLNKLTGAYVAAERLFQEALAIRQARLGQNLEVAQTESALGAVYQAIGDLRRAEPLYKDALAIRQQRLAADHPDVAESLSDLAALYLAMADFAQAQALYQQALTIRQKRFGAEHPAVALSLSDLGSVEKARGDFPRAERLLLQALTLRLKRPGGESHPETALSHHRLGALYFAMGDYPRAEQAYNRALHIRQRRFGADHPEVAESLSFLATLYIATGRTAQAITYLTRAMVTSERLLRAVGMVSSEARMDALLKILRAQEEITYSLLLDPKTAAQAAPLAMAVALLRKGRSVDEAASTSRAIYQGLGPEERERFERLKALRSQIARAQIGGVEPGGEGALRRLTQEADRLEQELSQRSAPLRKKSQLPRLEEMVRRTAATLTPESALVEVVAFRPFLFRATGSAPHWGALRYVALVLDAGGQVRLADLGEGAAINDALQDYLQLITAPMHIDDKRERNAALKSGRQPLLRRAQELDRLVMGPVRPLLAGRRQLYLSLDGPLNLLPLETLHDGRGYLIDSYQLTYLTSGRDLLRSSEARPGAGATSVALLARPEFMTGSAESQVGLAPATRGLELVSDDTPALPQKPVVGAKPAAAQRGLRLRTALDPLKGTEEEARAIQKLLPEAQVLLGSAATKDALLSLQAPGILHVATHGLFRPDSGRGAAGTRGLELVGEASPAAPTASKPSPAAGAPVAGTAGALGLPMVAPTPEDPLLSSMLLLAGVGTAIRDGDQVSVLLQPSGLATSLEVAGMNLWGTQLVVLSACETGRGDVRNLGQGVYGLRRAVMVAGAETLVTSLWKVDDLATRDLMARYYKSLLGGRGRAESMREAALAVRKTRPHVGYWAPFIVIGRGDRLAGIGKESPPSDSKKPRRGSSR